MQEQRLAQTEEWLKKYLEDGPKRMPFHQPGHIKHYGDLSSEMERGVANTGGDVCPSPVMKRTTVLRFAAGFVGELGLPS